MFLVVKIYKLFYEKDNRTETSNFLIESIRCIYTYFIFILSSEMIFFIKFATTALELQNKIMSWDSKPG